MVSIPEIRDYERINARLAHLLDAGHRRVRLAGAEGQRLLASGLRGSWAAVVAVEGRAGPELAAALDAPGLIIACDGPAGDGAGRGLRAGRLLILGDAGDVVGYNQEGGVIVVAGAAGHRAGLAQAGGLLVLGGPVGRLAGERQAGGHLALRDPRVGPYLGHARRGGRLIGIGIAAPGLPPAGPDDRLVCRKALGGLEGWLDDRFAMADD